MKYAYVEITERCNLGCPFCPSAEYGGGGEMSPRLFEQVLDSLRGHVGEIFLHVLGEPLLHPRFSEILRKIHPFGFRLNLTTNGILILRHAESLLSELSLRQVNISTHAYAYLPRTKALAHLDGTVRFAKRLAAERPDVYLNFRLWNDSSDALSADWNAEVVRTLSEEFGVNLSLGEFSVRHKSYPIAGRLYLHRDSRFSWPDGTGDSRENGSCRGILDQCAVLYDGRVVPCCLDYRGSVLLGKFPEETFDSIFGGGRASCMRTGFLQHRLVEPFCMRCPFARRFG